MIIESIIVLVIPAIKVAGSCFVSFHAASRSSWSSIRRKPVSEEFKRKKKGIPSVETHKERERRFHVLEKERRECTIKSASLRRTSDRFQKGPCAFHGWRALTSRLPSRHFDGIAYPKKSDMTHPVRLARNKRATLSRAKSTNGTWSEWCIFDDRRITFNPDQSWTWHNYDDHR